MPNVKNDPHALSLLPRESGPSTVTVDFCSFYQSHLTMSVNPRKVVVFSGGSAANSLVDVFNEVIERNNCALTYVIPISDNGGSSSELIRVFGGPGIGDVRSMNPSLLALCPSHYRQCIFLRNMIVKGQAGISALHVIYGVHSDEYVPAYFHSSRPSCTSHPSDSCPHTPPFQPPAPCFFRRRRLRVPYPSGRDINPVQIHTNTTSHADTLDPLPSPP